MSDCDVLICGLGPVGQLLALLLSDLGVSVIALDEAGGPHELPRAAVIDDEVLRIFQAAGVEQRILADSQPQGAVSYVTARGRTIQMLNTEAGELGHPPLVSIHQPSIERTLTGALAGRDHVELRWLHRLESFELAAEQVIASARAVGGGDPEPITARYLVGCDGGRSTVRSLLQIPFGGLTYEQRWLVVDALVDRPMAKAPHPHFVGDPRRPIVSLPMSPRRHRWEWMLHPGEEPGPFLEPARISELLAPWIRDERVEVERAVVYTFHARTAARWRAGRALLAGDAAHLMPPFAGQGFSSGARDAGNLAWKLAAVLRGAPERLLDSYEAERRPHVTSMQKLAVRWGGVVQTASPRVGWFRDATIELLDRLGALRWIQGHVKPLPTYSAGAFSCRPARLPFRRSVGSLFPQPLVGGERLDDLLGRGWSAVTTSSGLGDQLRGAGVSVVELPGLQWLARHGASWVLLRPDRFVFACGTEAQLPHALQSLRAITGEAPVHAHLPSVPITKGT